MGVLGLTPFLQRTCPEVVQRLPNRLKDIAGKTVVFDGTLITQRLHYAPIPHPYRHVLGWYRLAQELRESDVRAICVFDGKERSSAKARENERRSSMKKLTLARGSLETDRLRRLRKLFRLLDHYNALRPEKRQSIADLLAKLSSEPLVYKSAFPRTDYSGQIQPEHFLYPPETAYAKYSDVKDDFHLVPQNELPKVGEGFDVASERSWFCDLNSYSGEPFDFSWEDEENVFNTDLERHRHDSTLVTKPDPIKPAKASGASEPIDKPLFLESKDAATTRGRVLDSNADELQLNAREEVERFTADFPVSDKGRIRADEEPDLNEDFASLYLEYRYSIPQLASITPAAEIDFESKPDTTQDIDKDEQRVEYLMSRTQFDITQQEGRLWEGLTSPSSITSLPSQEQLDSLARRSEAVRTSYERRTISPTRQTYEEVKEILAALNIPVIDTTGAFEAEALASSLVLNGWADYVGSEDTDVLLYQAPLLRGLTSKREKMVVLDPTQILEALSLPSHSHFLDLALLLGTDFSSRIKNLGPSNALKYIKEYGSVERVVEALENGEIQRKGKNVFEVRRGADVYLSEIGVARQVFTELPPVTEDLEKILGAWESSGNDNPDEQATGPGSAKRAAVMPPSEESVNAVMKRYGLWWVVKAEDEANRARLGAERDGIYSDDPYSLQARMLGRQDIESGVSGGTSGMQLDDDWTTSSTS